MNCLANILHKICNASVFFSAYRTCYNSIVKIEQKRKSAFYRALFLFGGGRNFTRRTGRLPDSAEFCGQRHDPRRYGQAAQCGGGGCACRGQCSTAVLSAAGVQHPPDDRHCCVGAVRCFWCGRYRRRQLDAVCGALVPLYKAPPHRHAHTARQSRSQPTPASEVHQQAIPCCLLRRCRCPTPQRTGFAAQGRPPRKAGKAANSL